MRIALSLLLVLSVACTTTTGLKSAVADHSRSIHDTSEVMLAEVEPCKSGQAQACDDLKKNAEAIRKSAEALQGIAK